MKKVKHFVNKIFPITVSVFGIFLIFFTAQARLNIIDLEISLEKNSGIEMQEPIVVNFSKTVLKSSYEGGTKIYPSEDFSYSWSDDGKKLTITPKKFWKPETKYKIIFSEGKSLLLTKIESQEVIFSTVDFPKITSIIPAKDAKDVILDIEDPIVVDFDKPLKGFFVKFLLNPNFETAYIINPERTQFKVLPKNSLKAGQKYEIRAYMKYEKDSDNGFKEIYKSSFETFPPSQSEWEKDFTLRLEQARKFTAPKIKEGKYIDINLSQQIMTIFENGIVVDSFLVSTGKRGMETTKGEFKIKNKASRVWSKKYGLYMPYWMAVASDGSFGIHELPEWPGGYKEGANHLGTPVSHGCIRLGVGSAKTVFDWTEVGTPVIIY